MFTDPRDVARVEARTFMCTEKKHDSVPHYKGEVGRLARWMSPEEVNNKLDGYYPGCMRGNVYCPLPPRGYFLPPGGTLLVWGFFGMYRLEHRSWTLF